MVTTVITLQNNVQKITKIVHLECIETFLYDIAKALLWVMLQEAREESARKSLKIP